MSNYQLAQTWGTLQWPASSSLVSEGNSVTGPSGGSGHNPSLVNPPNPHSNVGQAIDFPIFVGDLPPEASTESLMAIFRDPTLGFRPDKQAFFFRGFKDIRPFHSCKAAKVMRDPKTGISRGYGFVRFADKAEQQRALLEMNGIYCGSRPMRISAATERIIPPFGPAPASWTWTPFYGPESTEEIAPEILEEITRLAVENPYPSEKYNPEFQCEPTIFIGGLPPITERKLEKLFAPWGEIHHVKVLSGKSCGFVNFVRKANAQRAVQWMHHFDFEGNLIRVNWGLRTAAGHQMQPHSTITPFQSIPLLRPSGIAEGNGGVEDAESGFEENEMHDFNRMFAHLDLDGDGSTSELAATIKRHDHLIQAIQTEVRLTKLENRALRHEVEALKLKLRARGILTD